MALVVVLLLIMIIIHLRKGVVLVEKDVSDISSFNFTLGEPISVLAGIDYGSGAGSPGDSSVTTANNLGDPYLAFDGNSVLNIFAAGLSSP